MKTKPVETVLLSAHQYASEGGTSFLLTQTDHNGYRNFSLGLMMQSSTGVNHRSILPLFATTAPILRAIADELDKQAILDPAHLSHADAEITSAMGTVFYQNIDGTVTQVSMDNFDAGEHDETCA